MRVVVVTPPTPAVTWEEADAHLRLGGDLGEKSYVERLIAAVTAILEGPDGWLGRAIGVQTLEARFSLLTVGSSIRLPFPPVVELVDVKYLDMAGAEQIADLEDFDLIDDTLAPVDGGWVWEGGSLKREAGRVEYRAGYETVPAPIKAAILIMVAELYEKREMAATGISGAAADLLSPYRVYR
ncbi:MAG TPA: head-tail connector protein [Sphingobium sp.]|uniref:head-tail connector protein n=1 Tax=Sphingobium sp. TaxID=1912891 RepID=UPI002ED30493